MESIRTVKQKYPGNSFTGVQKLELLPLLDTTGVKHYADVLKEFEFKAIRLVLGFEHALFQGQNPDFDVRLPGRAGVWGLQNQTAPGVAPPI